MRALFSTAALATLAILGIQVAVWGQGTRSTLGSGGTSGSGLSTGMGSSGMGTSSTGSSGTFGNRSLGSSLTAGNRSFAGGSTGARGGMGTGMGNSGTPGAGNTSVGQTQNATQFMNNAYRQGFVGASSANVPNILGGVMAGQNNRNQNLRSGTMGLNSPFGMQGSGRTGMNQFGNRQGLNQFGGNMLGGNMANRELPTALRATFDYPKPPGDKLTTALTQRLSQTKALRTQSPVTVVAQNGTVTLRGTVASEHARAVAERLVRLEPGVWKVNNELVVAGAPADSTPP